MPDEPTLSAERDAPPEVDGFAAELYCTDMTLDQVRHDLAGRFVYLATPYSRLVTDARGKWSLMRSLNAEAAAVRWAASLTAQGVSVFSPIALSAQIVHRDYKIDAGLFDPLDAQFWMRWCLPALERCEAVVVPPIKGRAESAGVREEVRYALTTVRIPVYWMRAGEAARVEGPR